MGHRGRPDPRVGFQAHTDLDLRLLMKGRNADIGETLFRVYRIPCVLAFLSTWVQTAVSVLQTLPGCFKEHL